MTILRLHSIRKQYPGESDPAVNGLDIHIESGTTYGLLGPNGAGKSSTVAMICGLVSPDSGSIDRGYHRLGLAPQEIALFPTLTARENLHYFGNLYGMKGSSLRHRIHDLLKQFQLDDKSDKQVHTFSGGMKRRLNLIAAILHSPDFLILDEPTAGVDVQSRNLIVDILQELRAQGTTLLYSSHLMEEAHRLCNRIGIIDMGKLIVEGSPDELIRAHATDHLEGLFLKVTGKSIRS